MYQSMTSGRKAAGRQLALAVAGGGLWLAGAAVLAQAPGTPPASSAPAKPAAQKPSPPRTAIQLTPAERQTIDAAQAGKEKPARVEDALAPTPEDIKPRAADDTSNTTRIEQLHQSNRVSEVIVTPSGQSRSYVMQNREGQQPFGTTQMSPGLSVPMFFRFEFGRTLPPATNPPSPPAPPSR
jgi:hypothetical protein